MNPTLEYESYDIPAPEPERFDKAFFEVVLKRLLGIREQFRRRAPEREQKLTIIHKMRTNFGAHGRGRRDWIRGKVRWFGTDDIEMRRSRVEEDLRLQLFNSPVTSERSEKWSGEYVIHENIHVSDNPTQEYLDLWKVPPKTELQRDPFEPSVPGGKHDAVHYLGEDHIVQEIPSIIEPVLEPGELKYIGEHIDDADQSIAEDLTPPSSDVPPMVLSLITNDDDAPKRKSGKSRRKKKKAVRNDSVDIEAKAENWLQKFSVINETIKP